MKPEKDNIKKLFSSKLQRFEPDLPPSMWEKIDAGLPIQRQTTDTQKIAARKTSIYKYAAWIASAAAVIAIALFVFYPQNTKNETLATNEGPQAGTAAISPSEEKKEVQQKSSDKGNQQMQEQPRNNLSQAQSTRSIITPLTTGQARSPQKEEEQKQDILIAENDNKLQAPVSDENDRQLQSNADKIAENTEINDHTTPKQEVSEEELAEKIAALVAESRRGEELLADNYIPKNKKDKKTDKDSPSKGFQINAGGGGTFSKAKGEQIQLRKVNYLYSDMLESGNEVEAPILTSSQVQETKLYQRQEMKMEHNQPVTFGISVSKNISSRVSLETGIVYTYASSKYLSDISSDFHAYDSQYFHYLGLPLSINYKVFEWNKLQAYLSAGGVAQKDIYGRIRTSQNIPASENAWESESKTISQNRPQFSINSSLGVSYPLYKKLSVYTHVGAAYYIEANNRYETIYSDRKWLFNLNMGLKFDF